jgi:hypothetical protein
VKLINAIWQTHGKFSVLNKHFTALDKGKSCEPVNKKVRLLKASQVSEVILDSDSDKLKCDCAVEEKEGCE